MGEQVRCPKCGHPVWGELDGALWCLNVRCDWSREAPEQGTGDGLPSLEPCSCSCHEPCSKCDCPRR